MNDVQKGERRRGNKEGETNVRRVYCVARRARPGSPLARLLFRRRRLLALPPRPLALAVRLHLLGRRRQRHHHLAHLVHLLLLLLLLLLRIGHG